MKLSEVQQALTTISGLQFLLPNGVFVPKHFHITEVGLVTKNFIDCGGVVREEKKVVFQLWEANDFEHRLTPQKLNSIIQLSINSLNITDEEIVVEYQSSTIGKYGLAFDGINFLLTETQTDCLAQDKCGIPQEKLKVRLSDITKINSCTPGSGCC